jgi:hypothetical protein
LVTATIESFADRKCTVSEVAQKALPEAREICGDDYDAAITGWIKPIARRLMRKTPGPSGVPMLLPGIVLPYRIAVPASHDMEDYEATEDDEDDDERGDTGIAWVPLHMATIAEGRRNLGLRWGLIQRSTTEHDRIKLVVDEAASRTEDENAIIGEVLGLPQ